MMPLYEAKMLHLYDTRWATYEEDGSSRPMTLLEKAARATPLPRYWVSTSDIDSKIGDQGRSRSILGWRRICRATDARTLITTQGPRVGYGDSWFLAISEGRPSLLQAVWSSFAFDYIARQKLGGTNMNFFTVAQLPMIRPEQVSTLKWSLDRSLHAWVDLRVDRLNGWISDRDERERVRAELDAAAFHMFDLGREDVRYVMETFPIVKRKDVAEFGTYRTKDLILASYDAMAEAKASGTTYRAPWSEESP